MNVRLTNFGGACVTLAADIVGPADAQTLIFLHGGGQTRQSWGRALTQAQRRGYRAISLDLRGHGDSDWSPDGSYAIKCFADDVRAIIRYLGTSPVLIGASLGGLTALSIGADEPCPISGLVLVDVATRLEPGGTNEIAAFMRSAPDGFASIADAADAVASYLPHRPRPDDTSGLLRNLRLREDGRLHWHWDPAFLRPSSDSLMPDLTRLDEAAKRISVPTLLIRGSLSRVVSQEGAQEFLNLVPQAELVDVEGADHMVAGDANDRFNLAVFDFLNRQVPASTEP